MHIACVEPILSVLWYYEKGNKSCRKLGLAVTSSVLWKVTVVPTKQQNRRDLWAGHSFTSLTTASRISARCQRPLLGHWRLHFSSMEESGGASSIYFYSLWCISLSGRLAGCHQLGMLIISQLTCVNCQRKQPTSISPHGTLIVQLMSFSN